METALLCIAFSAVSTAGVLLAKKCFSDQGPSDNNALLKSKTYMIICAFSLIIGSVYIYLASVREQGIQYADCLRYFVIMSFMPHIGFIDFKLLIIPNKMLLCLLGFRALLVLQDYADYSEEVGVVLLAGLAAAFVGGIIFFLPRLFSKDSIGMGDAKLVMAAGLFYDLSRLFVFMLISLLLSSLVGIFLMVVRKRSRKTALPLAPFFTVGAACCAFLSVI